MIDSTDFEIIVEETFEELERQLDVHAVNGVDIRYDARTCTFEFSDISRLTLASDPGSQRLALRDTEGVAAAFYYHPVEEQWFDVHSEEPLLARIDGLLSKKLGHPIHLVDL